MAFDTFNFNEIMRETKETIIEIVRVPFEYWSIVPINIKYVVLIILLFLAIVFTILALKFKNKWMNKVY
jgi:hypothetical protein